MEGRYIIQMTISFIVGVALVGLAAYTKTWIPATPWHFLGGMIGGGTLTFVLVPIL